MEAAIGGDGVDRTIGELIKKQPGLNAEDVADAVLYVLGTPPHVQVSRFKLLVYLFQKNSHSVLFNTYLVG